MVHCRVPIVEVTGEDVMIEPASAANAIACAEANGGGQRPMVLDMRTLRSPQNADVRGLIAEMGNLPCHSDVAELLTKPGAVRRGTRVR